MTSNNTLMHIEVPLKRPISLLDPQTYLCLLWEIYFPKCFFIAGENASMITILKLMKNEKMFR
jgi:hypothetical protein